MKKIIILMLSLLMSVLLFGSNFNSYKSKVIRYKLSNGATLLVLEKHEVPIIHCITVANVGSVNEESGKTGIAHILEHMAFKGTTTIGTSNFAAEQKLNDEADAIFDQIIAARKRNASADEIAELQKKLDAKNEEVAKYVVPNEFAEIIKQRGGEDMNAGTSMDMTMYQVSFPSNKLELWMAMETDRFTNPVFREFYKERNVIIEEKRLRYDNSPQGKLISDISDKAYTVHPYHHPTIGYQEDLESITRKDVYDFFNKYYGAKNLVFVVVGDVQAEQVKMLADKYFATIPTRNPIAPITAVEPVQMEERSFTLNEKAQPMMFMAYHVPEERNQETPAIEALAYVLGSSQTSRLYKSLVEEKKVAVAAFAFNGLPGSKYPNLFLVGVIPSPGHTLDECSKVIDEEIAKLRKTPVTEKELASFKKQEKVSQVRRMRSGFFMAMQLGVYEAEYGDYGMMFDTLDRSNQVTAEQIQHAAEKYLIPTNRTTGSIVTKGEEK